MSDGNSAFDLIRYFEGYPSLKYAFAAGVMVITLRWILQSLATVRSGAAEQAQTADESRASRIERKINRIEWNMSELRREVQDLLDVVRPGPRRRAPEAPDFDSD